MEKIISFKSLCIKWPESKTDGVILNSIYMILTNWTQYQLQMFGEGEEISTVPSLKGRGSAPLLSVSVLPPGD